MKPKPPATTAATRLRRRAKATTTITLIRTYGVVFFLFVALVLLFTPPSVVDETSLSQETRPERGLNDPPTIIVECHVSTPHSQRPASEAANGKFRIAILEADANRKGSSAEAFLKLVDRRFYDGVYTFRVIKNFIVQWGVRSDLDESIESRPAKERKKEADIVSESGASAINTQDSTGTEANRMNLLLRKENRRGTITMISGPTGQVFVSIGDNRRLDKEGTIPFGVILEDDDSDDEIKKQSSGMRLIDRIYQGYKGGQGQIPAIHKKEIATKFPEMGRIDRCYRAS